MIACITTRWSGPGILRQMQEKTETSAPENPCEGTLPGRSARSRKRDLALSLPSNVTSSRRHYFVTEWHKIQSR